MTLKEQMEFEWRTGYCRCPSNICCWRVSVISQLISWFEGRRWRR